MHPTFRSCDLTFKEIENLMLYLRTRNPEDIQFISEMMRRFLDKVEQERGR